jgi:hypothetical protein
MTLDHLIYGLYFFLGFSVSQLMTELMELRRMRKAVERVASRLERLKD